MWYCYSVLTNVWYMIIKYWNYVMKNVLRYFCFHLKIFILFTLLIPNVLPTWIPMMWSWYFMYLILSCHMSVWLIVLVSLGFWLFEVSRQFQDLSWSFLGDRSTLPTFWDNWIQYLPMLFAGERIKVPKWFLESAVIN